MLARAELDPEAAHGLGLVHTVVRPTTPPACGAEDGRVVIDIVRGSGEAEVAAVLKEAGPDRWTGSLRAVGRLDVSAVAGHSAAAATGLPPVSPPTAPLARRAVRGLARADWYARTASAV